MKSNNPKRDCKILLRDGAAWAYSLEQEQTEGVLSKEAAYCFLVLLCLMKVRMSFLKDECDYKNIPDSYIYFSS